MSSGGQFCLSPDTDYYLGLKLFPDGRHIEIYNGPTEPIRKQFGHRKGFGQKQLSFSIETLKALSATIPDADRIQRRVL